MVTKPAAITVRPIGDHFVPWPRDLLAAGFVIDKPLRQGAIQAKGKVINVRPLQNVQVKRENLANAVWGSQ